MQTLTQTNAVANENLRSPFLSAYNQAIKCEMPFSTPRIIKICYFPLWLSDRT
ncbi:MAG: hypothetical protein RMX96_18240 [Nostoc sp. ChiSLP02]|nr:hypothetical protein [Nostoc sp. DedSLP05]MDZ8097638.1 hypothetical protein [Nostoc sp. DedSLP01]MDZ8186776.1 hypothetical protein [Nostoc sp. ChiSLP02]